MLQKYNRWKILKVFFHNPIEAMQLREISRYSGIAPISVKRYLNEFLKEGIITKKINKAQHYPIYTANIENPMFAFYKKIDIMISITDCGLLDYLNDNCMPESIVLFGSASRGEDTADSDIDIFLLSGEKKLDLGKFEKVLKRKISVFFSDDFNSLSKELKNNIINGIKLTGYMKVF